MATVIVAVWGVFVPSLAAEVALAIPSLESGGIRFQPATEAEGWRVTIAGPDDYYLRQEFTGEAPTLSLTHQGSPLPQDGSYIWELRALRNGHPAVGFVQSGSFQVQAGAILLLDDTPERQRAAASGSAAITPTDPPTPLPPDVTGDYYIGGRLAFGSDEIDGTESFGAYTKMLVEDDNIQLRFVDTSTLSGFPTTDWLIKLNDTSNAGTAYFRIEDLDAVTQPFRIDAAAATDSLRIDQNGRVGMGTATPATKLHVVGDTTLDGDFTVLSSRNAKEGFGAIDPTAVLARLADLPLAEWSYKGKSAVRHMGPVAEDFHALFQLGKDDRSINPLDVAGVALAAIQGLQSELADLSAQNKAAFLQIGEQDREINRLETDRETLEERVAALEQRLEPGNEIQNTTVQGAQSSVASDL